MRGIDQFRFGVNYVPSKRWYYCWNDFSAGEIAEDFDIIAAHGADHIRLMTIWSYFQPDPNWVSPAHLDRLSQVMDIAAERGLDVLITVFTGYLTGRHFRPNWEKKHDIFTDPFMLEAEERYLRALADVAHAKGNFMGFDLGNEINCSWGTRRVDGDAWSRRWLELCHQLAPGKAHVNGVNDGPFFREVTFSPQGLTRDQDIVSLHCWTKFTGALERGGHALAKPSVHLAAAMTALAKSYAGDPAKPVWIQEFGASEAWMGPEVIPEFMERTIRSAAAAGATWFTWWASHDITRAFFVEELEYSLGLFTVENKPKPQAEVFRRLAEEYRAADAAEVNRGAAIPAPPAPPQSTQATWDWLDAWIDALGPDWP